MRGVTRSACRCCRKVPRYDMRTILVSEGNKGKGCTFRNHVLLVANSSAVDRKQQNPKFVSHVWAVWGGFASVTASLAALQFSFHQGDRSLSLRPHFAGWFDTQAKHDHHIPGNTMQQARQATGMAGQNAFLSPKQQTRVSTTRQVQAARRCCLRGVVMACLCKSSNCSVSNRQISVSQPVTPKPMGFSKACIRWLRDMPKWDIAAGAHICVIKTH